MLHRHVLLFSTALALLTAGALTGCGDDGPAPTDTSDVPDIAEPEDVPEEVEAGPEPLTDWPDHVIGFPFLDDREFTGDLADGEVIDIGWADEPDVGCWGFLDRTAYAGRTVFYAMDVPLPGQNQQVVTLQPADGVEASVWAFGLSIGTYYFPPDVPSVQACTAAASPGPGEATEINLNNLTEPLNWLIAVTAPEGVESGEYTLTIDRN